MIFKGLLNDAEKKALKVTKLLLHYVEAGIPIVGLEPSCILTIKDDDESLIGKEALILRKSCFT